MPDFITQFMRMDEISADLFLLMISLSLSFVNKLVDLKGIVHSKI